MALKYDSITTINRAWDRSASFILTQWLKIIPHMIRSYYRCCYIHVNEPVILSHCVHLKLWHRFHALLNVCSDRDNTIPLISPLDRRNVNSSHSQGSASSIRPSRRDLGRMSSTSKDGELWASIVDPAPSDTSRTNKPYVKMTQEFHKSILSKSMKHQSLIFLYNQMPLGPMLCVQLI